MVANDENVENFDKFLESYVTNDETLLNVFEALKCKLYTENLEEDFIRHIVPYVEKYPPSVTKILELSHVACTNCDIYKPSLLYNWIKNNQELFETDVPYFSRLFKYFNIKNTYPSYPIKRIYVFEEDYPMSLSDQTLKEKLKSLNTIIKYFDKSNL